jgi:xylulokinase
MRRTLGLSRLVEITGNDAFPGFTAPKLLWVRDHEPDIYARVEQVLLPKDYVRFRLTGEYATDRAGAGGTLMLDLGTRDWSGELLEAFDIPAQWLPPTHEGTEETGRITAEAAQVTGLAPGTPVFGGGGDQAAQGVGVGAVEPGVVALTLGTSGVVFASSDRPLVESQGRLHAFPHAVPGKWHVMGVMLSAAGSLRWYRDVVAPGVGFEQLLTGVEAIEPGSEGLIFLPYLSGERTPHGDPHIRGAFSGLTLKHGRSHMTRAVLEGVAFGLRDNFALMQEVGLDSIEQVRISGGGAKSLLWRQILADVCGVDLVAVETTEGAAFGAALLAGVGSGIWSSVAKACASAVELGATTSPVAEVRQAYDTSYARFRVHYPALRPLFRD